MDISVKLHSLRADTSATVAAVLLVVASALAVAYYFTSAGRQADQPLLTHAQAIALQECTEGAALVHDVRWAAACMTLAEQDKARYSACVEDPAIIANPRMGMNHCNATFGQSDGSAECTLPDARSADLYALLRKSEERCMADARAATP